MKMPKKTGIVFVTAGAVLILSALLLFLYNFHIQANAGRHAALLTEKIQSAIAASATAPSASFLPDADASRNTQQATPAQTDETLPPETEPVTASLPAQMPTVTIDGYDYIGFLYIPDLELELPVMADWDQQRLSIAPCRHAGSSRTDDLVIAAHNYNSLFGSLFRLGPGAEVRFTDIDSITNRYAVVSEPVTLSAYDVVPVLNSGHDLVLYTCTPGGATRVVVFCDRAGDAPPADTEN